MNKHITHYLQEITHSRTQFLKVLKTKSFTQLKLNLKYCLIWFLIQYQHSEGNLVTLHNICVAYLAENNNYRSLIYAPIKY